MDHILQRSSDLKLHVKYFNTTIRHQLANDHKTIPVITLSQFGLNYHLILKDETLLWMNIVKLRSKVLQTNFKVFSTSISSKMLIKIGFLKSFNDLC